MPVGLFKKSSFHAGLVLLVFAKHYSSNGQHFENETPERWQIILILNMCTAVGGIPFLNTCSRTVILIKGEDMVTVLDLKKNVVIVCISRDDNFNWSVLLFTPRDA